MKVKLPNGFIKKIVATMFAVAFILLGVCIGSDDAKKVYAAELTEDASGKFKYATYTDKETVKGFVGDKVPETVDGYVFAGWYTDVKCTEAIKNDKQVDESTETIFYAKYVPEGVLSTKVQISSENLNEGGTDTRNMRFVSSVDDLVYGKVGFALKYKENGSDTWKKYKNEGDIVFTRIAATTDADEYKFSPKVVNTKSEYFMTATWTGADNNGLTDGPTTDFDTNYYVRAYWVTMDGVTVYGPVRYVSVNDGLKTNIINVAVKGATTESGTVEVSGYEGATGTVAYHDGTYSHIRIDLGTGKDRSDVLKSVTRFTVDGKTVDYRNLYTKYTGTGTEDTSWYDVYGNRAGEYVIATSADLYGLMSVVNNAKFYFLLEDVSTVYMIADIEVNKGTASPTAWSTSYAEDGETKTGTDYTWTGIGTGTKVFKGVFDGQGHTISGINGTNGLFYNSSSTTEIRNVNLTNTYLVPPQLGSGSIVSRASGGTIESVYSDAFINNNQFHVGGIVGRQESADTVLTIQKCQYDGTISTGKAGVGGILGNTYYGEINITNCEFSGSINTTVNEIGGIVGTNPTTAKKLTITDCESSGSITAGWYTGGFVGKNDNSLTITGCEYLGSINSSQHQSGGLVGINNQSLTITDCKSSGSIETSGTQFGGLVGLNNSKGTLEIIDCLFDGEITITGTTEQRVIGGLVGKNLGTTCSITTCLNSGILTNNTGQNITAVCRLVGMNENANMQLNKVYYTNEGFNGGEKYYSPTTPTNPQLCYEVTEAEISGKCAFFNTSLNFDENGKWALVAEGTPVLKTFADEVSALPEVPEDVNIDWYKGVESSTYTLGDSANENDVNVSALKGLAYLVSEGITFAGKTVNLGADVTLNTKAPTTSEAWTTYIKENNLTEWEAIGTTDYEFTGIFDGGMNSITGLYMDNDTIGTGFFRSVGEGSTIQNLKIVNSYFKGGSNNGYAYVGSVVGNCAGNLKNIYSNAVVNAGGHFAGGIVGQLWNSTSTTSERTIVSNCWFDGEVIIVSRNNCGGIFGILNAGYFEMKDCLNTGKINHSGARYGWIGGFGGRVYGSTDRWDFTTPATLKYGLKMANCLNVGEVTNSSIVSVGSIIGAAVGGTVALDNVYATSESYACGIGSSYATQPNLVSEADITGDSATTNFAPLSGENSAWVVQEGSTPILKVFNN